MSCQLAGCDGGCRRAEGWGFCGLDVGEQAAMNAFFLQNFSKSNRPNTTTTCCSNPMSRNVVKPNTNTKTRYPYCPTRTLPSQFLGDLQDCTAEIPESTNLFGSKPIVIDFVALHVPSSMQPNDRLLGISPSCGKLGWRWIRGNSMSCNNFLQQSQHTTGAIAN